MARQHLAMFNSSITNGAVLLQVTNIADPIIATSGSGFLVPGSDPAGPPLNKLAAVAAYGTNCTRVQLTSNSIRQLAPFDVAPVNVGTLIESPPRVLDFTDRPIQLFANEELDAFGVQSNAGAQRIGVPIWFCDGPLTPITGHMFTMHWTASATLTANAWSQVTPTFDNGLPAGLLAIVGFSFFSAGGVVARVVPRTGAANRPGGFCYQARDGFDLPWQRYGAMGQLITFQNTQPPLVEFFSISADTAEEGYFDMMLVG